jgi:hypothetical protein
MLAVFMSIEVFGIFKPEKGDYNSGSRLISPPGWKTYSRHQLIKHDIARKVNPVYGREITRNRTLLIFPDNQKSPSV